MALCFRLPLTGLAVLAATACSSVAGQGGAGDPVPDAATGFWRGVNLSGAEFGSGKIPGTYGKDYIYPGAKDFDRAVDMGLDLVRLPVKWGRLQPALGAPLAPAEVQRLDDTIALAEARDLVLLLDIHDYGRYDKVKADEPAVADGLVDLWTRLAVRYRNRPLVAFGIMNEPHGFAAGDWRPTVDRVLAAIREEGAGNLVLVPGTRWTGAHSWRSGRGRSSNADSLAGLTDPGGNMLIEMHQYLDKDSSGTKDHCVSPERAVQRLEGATEWLREEGQRALLAEVGAPANERCLAAMQALFDAVEAAPDAWAGWAWWAAGPWWPDDYAMKLWGDTPEETPQAAQLKERLKTPVRVDP